MLQKPNELNKDGSPIKFPMWIHYLIQAPAIMGNAANWKALHRPIPSAIDPLNKHPTRAPPKHILTTSPASKDKSDTHCTHKSQANPSNLKSKAIFEQSILSANAFPAKPRSIEMLSRGSLTTLPWIPSKVHNFILLIPHANIIKEIALKNVNYTHPRW